MNALNHWSLRSKVLAAAAIAIFIGFSITIGLIATTVYQDARAVGYQRATEEAHAYAGKVEDYFSNGFNLPRHLASAIQGFQIAGAVPERKALDQMILRLLGDYPDASGLWTIWEPNALDGKDDAYRADQPHHDPSGRYSPYMTRSADGKITQDQMVAGEQAKGLADFASHPQDYKPPYEAPGWGDFYYVPKQRQQDTVTEPYPYEVQGKKVLMSSLVTIIKDSNGKFAGVAAVDLPLVSLQGLFAQIKPMGTGHVELLSNGGMMVVDEETDTIGKPADPKNYPDGFADNIKAGKAFEFERDGELHIYRPIKVGNTGQNWSLGVAIPISAIVADAAAARNKAIVVGIVALAAILVALSVLLTALTLPLKRLAVAMEELAGGEGDLTRRLTVSSRDEIGRTSDAFNRFIGRLQDMFREVRTQSDAVGGATGQLNRSAQEVARASGEQSEAATATAASVEEVTVSIQHIANSSSEFARIAREAGNTTNHGQQLVERVAGAIETLNERIGNLAQTMQNLDTESNKINHIVQAIKEIADQTNLLALNASIEAARAGEQGRGFAVVADEVRKLAERTGSATVEISQIVVEIQREIGAAVGGVSHAQEQISSSVALSREASGAIGEVRNGTGMLVDNVSTIADATREQATASTDIAHNVERISSMTQVNNDAIAQVSQAVAHLETLAGTLREIVGRFKL
ncbi:Methyl-accepting chemotaxis protein PctC [Andreprevotia sp. IGB-42]|uniref:methyl-accepting chemotaxis protein n=1 Tax=Andreprevotia sp. IGB-42 TaxID=2497473 RepID=UPI001357383C|nr:methyl-accepting chemotaxis protein [Andreprevotia sp. IGB-42]KAF0811973.1 Methyl-accepting chemotaxis protein PctC [Andreprevotia sp. IGB-42]